MTSKSSELRHGFLQGYFVHHEVFLFENHWAPESSLNFFSLVIEGDCYFPLFGVVVALKCTNKHIVIS